MKTALDKAFKIIDKIAPDHKKENLAILARAIRASTDDPFVVLWNAGIDIEPELEEFRQFLAEISEKKVKEKPKFPVTERTSGGIPAGLMAIAKGLQFAGYSEEAMKWAERELWKLIDGLLGDEANAVGVFYAVKLLRLIQRRDVEGIEKFRSR